MWGRNFGVFRSCGAVDHAWSRYACSCRSIQRLLSVFVPSWCSTRRLLKELSTLLLDALWHICHQRFWLTKLHSRLGALSLWKRARSKGYLCASFVEHFFVIWKQQVVFISSKRCLAGEFSVLFFFRDRVTLNIDKTWFKMDCLQNLWRIVRIVVGHRWDWDDAAFFFSLEQDPGLVSQFGCWHLHRLCHRLRRFGGNEAAAESWISQLKFLYNPVYGGSVHQLCDRLFLCPSFQQKVLSKLGFSRFFFKEWCAYWIQLCDFGIKER